ncbi:hypothetical protein GLW08_08165 [Pontibacillus yanchengensis]|uniref:Uncharacterized protein n=1 Tax=Pontibacillus yanchengensis TaxID=462910 RepID=A0ACC7VEV2_9BACI|nr:hypothetical protein [Pontibacillus yanchengensis]MYL53312.1 hypothetical protein [Pontibacillus yanchengensis]
MRNPMHELYEIKNKFHGGEYVSEENLKQLENICRTTGNQEARSLYSQVKKHLKGDDQ